MAHVGFLGSAFNPPHQGHIHLAEQATRSLALDHLLFVPTLRAPHKPIEELWGYEMRVFLARVAFFLLSPEEMRHKTRQLPRLPSSAVDAIVSTYTTHYQPRAGWQLWEAEKEREGPSYTIDTLKEYKKNHPDDTLALLIGQDQATLFETWREYETLFTMATVYVATRPNAGALPALPFVFLPPFAENISSSEIREAWKTHRPLHSLVPPWVAAVLEAIRSD